jgi:glycosyltransferase involved in cell wall biosynthesis
MLSDLPQTIIVVPCFNEEGRLKLEEFKRFINESSGIELLFVDDGSKDDTWRILQEMASGNEQKVYTLKLHKNQGKAEAVRQGVLAALKHNPEYIGFWDADLAVPMEDVKWFEETLTGNNKLKMVIGCRLKRLGSNIERSSFRHYLGRSFATIVSIHLRLPVYDTQCGAKLLTSELCRQVFAEPFSSKWFFDVEIFKRMIRIYGTQTTIGSVLELPLKQWIDGGGSKVKLIEAAWQFYKLLTAKK